MPHRFQSTLPVWGATSQSTQTAHGIQFQSTLPVWGATCEKILRHLRDYDFNPRSPCGERPAWTSARRTRTDFNPRSPCGERRGSVMPDWKKIKFQSTLPVWGATHFLNYTHGMGRYFNPRSPCGERLCFQFRDHNTRQFQSTLPVWGATTHVDLSRGVLINFNPRSPCGERPRNRHRLGRRLPDFNPRSPCGERRTHIIMADKIKDFNPRSPCGERPEEKEIEKMALTHFNPRSPCGERQQRYTNFKVHLWRRGRIFASLREERRDSHQAAALRDRLLGENRGANLPAFSVYYGFAVRESRCPPANSCSCSQNAPPSFRTGCPGSKTAASPFRHP